MQLIYGKNTAAKKKQKKKKGLLPWGTFTFVLMTYKLYLSKKQNKTKPKIIEVPKINDQRRYLPWLI